MSELSAFEGIEVVSVGVEMPNAAGGLQEAMKFDPVEWHHGDEGYVVLHYTVQKVRFDPTIKGQVEPLRRVHVLHVDEAAPIDGAAVREVLDEQRERIRKAKDEASGQTNLLDGEDEGDPNDPPEAHEETQEAPEDDAAPPVADSPEDGGYDEWSHKELQEECKRRGVPANGSKEALMARLEAHDEGAAPSPARGDLKSV